MLKNHATTVANFLEVDLPTPNARGHFEFEFKDDKRVSLGSAKNGDLVVFSYIGTPLEEDQKEGKMKQFLKWNLAMLNDAEETLTWDPEFNQLMLYKQLMDTEISDRPLLNHLEAFLNSLEFWNTAFTTESEDSQSSPIPS